MKPHSQAGYMEAIFFLAQTNFFLASRGEPYMTPFPQTAAMRHGPAENPLLLWPCFVIAPSSMPKATGKNHPFAHAAFLPPNNAKKNKSLSGTNKPQTPMVAAVVVAGVAIAEIDIPGAVRIVGIRGRTPERPAWRGGKNLAIDGRIDTALLDNRGQFLDVGYAPVVVTGKIVIARRFVSVWRIASTLILLELP